MVVISMEESCRRGDRIGNDGRTDTQRWSARLSHGKYFQLQVTLLISHR
jgi:hypothetical protein